MSSAINQFKLLNSSVPIEVALKNPNLNQDEKQKLRLVQEIKDFAEHDLHLNPTKNYSTFVKLNRPYVTYVVSAAYKWELKHYQWNYPFLGKMPYKGYFEEADAKNEELRLIKEGLDTYSRGVTAYSTLGWFKDPLLSSMLRSKDYDLVNTLIHETVHATLYIKNEADFNERLASFLGSKGAELFYLKKEGPHSPTLKTVEIENEDEKTFSTFISKEIQSLEKWYQELPSHERIESKKNDRILLIQKTFKEKIQPQMKSHIYDKFGTLKLNNARLLLYKTYLQDLNDFERLYLKSGQNFLKFLEYCRTLESESDPNLALKKLVNSQI